MSILKVGLVASIPALRVVLRAACWEVSSRII